MACGAPVIASNTSSLPEVCGGAARYIDPASAESISAAIVELMASPALREQLKHKGLEQVKLFKWADTARGLYNSCLEAA